MQRAVLCNKTKESIFKFTQTKIFIMKKIFFIVCLFLPAILHAGESLELPELLSDTGLYAVVVIKNDRAIFKQFYQGKNRK